MKQSLRSLLCVLCFTTSNAYADGIGVVLAGSHYLFWDLLTKGIQQSGKDHGVNIAIRSPHNDSPDYVDANLQVKMAQYLLNNGSNALIIAPMPVFGMDLPIDFSVPVVLVDRASDNYKAQSTVLTDNFAAGRAAALTLRGTLRKGDRVGVFRLAPYITSTMSREDGFISAAKELGFNIAFDTYIGHDIRMGETKVKKQLSAQEKPVAAVFTSIDKNTLSTLRAIKDLPHEHRPLVIGFDYFPAFEGYLNSGELYAMVVQDPYQMGYQAVSQLVALQSGKSIPKRTLINFMVVTRQSLKNPLLREKLNAYHD